MKKTLVGLSIVIVLLTAGSVILPALVSAADAGWFGLINLVPTITTVSPMGVKSGSPGFTLTVNGTNFVSNSVVRWNGADRSTTYVGSDRLTATILVSDVLAVGTASVTVFNPAPGGGTSNAATVSINTKTNTTTTIVSDLPDPSQIGQSVTVVYTVTGSGGTPTGTVTVTDGSATCFASVATGSCALALTVASKRTLTATYGGDTTFNDSSSSAAHIVVGPMYMPFINRAPTPTPTPTPPPTPIPNPIQNGGFESPNDGTNGPWYGSVTNLVDNSTFGMELRNTLSGTGASPHSGSWALWLGGFEDKKWETLQKITIPPAGGSTLRYWLWVQSDEPVCDRDNIDGAWVALIQENPYRADYVDSFSLCTANQTSGWVKHDVNLSAYIGQTRWLAFTARNYGLNSNWFIDDVAMGTLSGAQFVPFRR